jgi:hypothetical protein
MMERRGRTCSEGKYKQATKLVHQNNTSALSAYRSNELPAPSPFSRSVRVPALAFVVEPINTVDGRALVVAAQDEEVFGVFDFVGQQQANGFHRLLAAVDVVPEEQVIRFGWEAAVPVG